MIVRKVRIHPHCRLAWYLGNGEVHSWDMEWERFDRLGLEDFVEFSKRDRLFIKIFRQYLPRGGRILEGGCGLGQWVIILGEMGYQIEGVDLSEMVIRKITAFYPRARVSVGNVISLAYPDNYFRAYISLGVVEHFEEGPQRALQEAHRVLGRGGILLCSVPYFNPIRRLAGKSPLPSGGLAFYQWAFTGREFGEILERTGFRVKDAIPYAVIKTLKDLLPMIGRFFSKRQEGQTETALGALGGRKKRLKQIVRNYLLNVAPLRRISGHMILFVAETVK